jgi:hypothetical protein
MKQAHDMHPHLQHPHGSSYSKSKALEPAPNCA